MNDLKQDLSISIVSYNNYNDVKLLVEAIEKYTSSSITKTIYIIDNADQREDYRKLESQYLDVIYKYAGDNLGFGKGHNYVLEDINSKYHAIVNPDILIGEDVFSILLEFMRENQNVGMVIPKIVDKNGNIQKVYRRYITVYDMVIRMFFKNKFRKRQYYHTMQDMDYNKPFQVPFGQGSFLVIRTDMLKELNGFDDRYFMYMEDADLSKRVNEISQLVYCPDTQVVHKWERGSHKNFRLLKIHIESMLKYFNKWGIKWK